MSKKWCMCHCPDESQPNGAIKEDPLITKDWAKKHLQKDGPGGIEHLVPSCDQYDSVHQPSKCGMGGLSFSN